MLKNFGQIISAVEIQQLLALSGEFRIFFTIEDAVSEWVSLGIFIQVGDKYAYADRVVVQIFCMRRMYPQIF